MKCRHCAAELSLPMVDLGAAPPSNAFLSSQHEVETHYPLRVLVCESCWLVQTDISLFKLDHDALFTKDYPYFSSTSDWWVDHARRYVDMVTDRFGLDEKSLTIEVTPDEYNQFLRYKVSQQHAAQVASTNAPVVRAPLPPRVIPKTNAPVAKKANATTISPQPASQTPTK
jgi:hypothetical protein